MSEVRSVEAVEAVEAYPVAVEVTAVGDSGPAQSKKEKKSKSRKISIAPAAENPPDSGPASTPAPDAAPAGFTMASLASSQTEELADIDQNIDAAAIRTFLATHHFPTGLIETIVESSIRAGPRYYVVDDSGSMDTGDGERIIHSDTRAGEANHVHCTRWEELGDSLRFHAGLVHASKMQAQFRFINGPRTHMPGDGKRGMDKILSVLDDPPSGVTPLCRHMKEVVDEIEHFAPALRQHRRKAIICIFTDGCPSDGDLVTVLNRLVDLPVWLMVRLSTNEDEVVSYWNSLDARLEVDMDILDDPQAEADEIHKLNPWLSYNYFLHRIREFGLIIREFDMLDEHAMSPPQIRRFLARLFNVQVEDIPDPVNDLNHFMHFVTDHQKHLIPPVVHNLHMKKPEPWVMPTELRHHVHDFGKVKKKGGCALL